MDPCMGVVSSSSMKVHQFARGFIDWDHRHEPSQQFPLSALCKRLRPLAPRLSTIGGTADALDLKSFIRPESRPIQLTLLPSSHHDPKRDATTHHQPQVETHPGGTRWNPTQEQIGILEMLYRGGMRTPNAHQIEQITAQLGKYGKIEGKNVFYWFQNHKARERQKLKRNNLGISHCPRNFPVPSRSTSTSGQAASSEGLSPYKRKCRGRRFESLEEEGDKTLELFPLHPQGGR